MFRFHSVWQTGSVCEVDGVGRDDKNLSIDNCLTVLFSGAMSSPAVTKELSTSILLASGIVLQSKLVSNECQGLIDSTGEPAEAKSGLAEIAGEFAEIGELAETAGELVTMKGKLAEAKSELAEVKSELAVILVEALEAVVLVETLEAVVLVEALEAVVLVEALEAVVLVEALEAVVLVEALEVIGMLQWLVDLDIFVKINISS